MNVSELETDILKAIGEAQRAQQLCGPVLDQCLPGMVGPDKRRRFRDLAHDLTFAMLLLDSAARKVQNGIRFCNEISQEPGQ